MNPKYEKFLLNLGLFGIKLGLENIRTILSKLGNPHRHPKIVHIAGTNGKGSTLVTLESLLIASDFSVGATISPHLQSINERFRINGKEIAEEALNQSFEKVIAVLSIDITQPIESQQLEIYPTYFEITIAIAFLLFQQRKVDYILLETGMGGRFDSTNVIENPVATIITSISKDHEAYLGSDLLTIAEDKAGIIKDAVPVFIAPQEREVTDKLSAIADEKKAPLYLYGQDFLVSEEKEQDKKQRIFSFGTEYRFQLPELSLYGEHQWLNTALALATYYEIVPQSMYLQPKALNQALVSVSWPGRLQYLTSKKRVLLDGAHNEAAMKALFKFVEEKHKDQPITFAVAWMKSKNLFQEFIKNHQDNFTYQPLETNIEGMLSGKEVYEQFAQASLPVNSPLTVFQLKQNIQSGKESDLTIITGSLYLIGAFLDEWKSTS